MQQAYFQLFLIIILKSQMSSIDKLTAKGYQYLLEIGYQQNQLKYLREVNIFFQFIFLYIFKLNIIEGNLNPTLQSATQGIMNVLLSPTMLIFCNLVSLLPPTIYVFWMILQANSNSDHPQLHDSAKTLKKIGTRVYIAAEFIFIISESLNFKLFYSIIIGTGQAHPLLLILALISTFLVTGNLLTYPYSLLLNKWTFSVIICCLSIDQNVMAIRVIALLFMLISFRQETYLNTSIPFERSLKLLLLALFVFHVLVDNVSMLYFVMLNLTIVALVFTYPTQLMKNNKLANEVILDAMEKFRKEKGLTKSQQIQIMKIFLTYEASLLDDSDFFFDSTSDITYQSISKSFKSKIMAEQLLHKEDDTFKLQYFRYAILHQKLNLGILHKIQTFNNELRESTKFREKVQLLEIKHLIAQKFTKRFEQMNLIQVMTICHKLEQANVHLNQILQILDVYWKKFQNKQLTETHIYKSLAIVEKKEKEIVKIINELKIYPQAKTQILVYNYALKLFNFDYESQDLKPSEYIHQSLGEVTGCYFIIIQENKIVEISSEMLIELRRKKEEVIGESLEQLLPSQLIDFIEKSYKSIFDSENEPHKLVLPFLDVCHKMTPYRVQLEVKYHIEKGLQYVIHFFKSQDLKQSPCFFYCSETDKILYHSQMFSSFLSHYKRKMDKQMMASDLFGSDLNRSILEEEKTVNDIVVCTLVRQKTRQINIEVNMKIIQVFSTQKLSYVIIMIQDLDCSKLEGSSNIRAMKTFIGSKMKQTREEELKEYKNQINSKNESQITFCRIPNSYETTILQKMTKVNINCRWSYLKLVGILILGLIVALFGGVFFSRMQIQHMKNEIELLMAQESKKSQEIESTYFLFYQYYQYYQIKHYPQQILDIQPYDIDSIVNEYYIKSNENIVKLMSVPQNNLPSISYEYTLEFPHYNTTENTSSTSIIDFLSDLKRALNNNDPTFSIVNEHNVQTLIKSYQRINSDLFSHHLQEYDFVFIVVMAIFIFIFFVIKCVFLRIRKVSKEILGVYEIMDNQYVEETIQKYTELKSLVQYSGSQNNIGIDIDEESALGSTGQLYQEEKNGLGSEKIKIKKQSLGDILLSSNYLMVILLATFLFLLGGKLTVSNYSKNMTLVILKNYNVHKAVINIVKPAEKYLEDSIQELLPPEKRKYSSKEEETQINMSLYLDQLPQQFAEYKKLEWKVLGYNLCEYSYLNSGPLYDNINCSLIFNGIMDKSLTETNELYLSVVREYSGSASPISQLGKIFRDGAKYPVFMEICYTRRTLNNIIRYLQDKLLKYSQSYITSMNKSLADVLYYSFILFPLILIVSMLQMKQICSQCNAIVKSFRLLPMSYLLNVKITKFLKKQEILEKVEMMPI